MIQRLKGKEVYNPIREHIKIGFKLIEPSDSSSNDLFLAKIRAIANDLQKHKFDPDISRVLVFINSRNKTEEGVNILSDELEELKLSYYDKVDFYHAGLDGIQREEKYDNYQKGKTVILFATKAFGMGMDIKNIHYIYHIGPSTSFEDFLQEIGRAGRDRKYLEKGGFSEEKPIQTKCFLAEGDFKKMKDRNHKELLTILNIQDAFIVLLEYIDKYKIATENDEKMFAIPFDLLNQSDAFNDENKKTLFRIILYWLERFKRIKLGMYASALLPIEIKEKGFKDEGFSKGRNTEIKRMLIKAKKYKKNKNKEADIQVSYKTLKQWLGVSYNDVNKYLIRAQKLGFIKVNRNINVHPTKLRSDELKESERILAITVKGVFRLAREIMQECKLGRQTEVLGGVVDSIINESINDIFSEDDIYWEKYNKGEKLSAKDIANKLREDFIEKRSKFAYYLIGNIPNVRIKETLLYEKDGKGEYVYYIYNGCTRNREWQNYLDKLEENTIKFIQIVSNKFFKNKKEYFNIIDLMIELGTEDENEFQLFLNISKYLGYLKGSGGRIATMGIECEINNRNDIDVKDQTSDDYTVTEEFNESNSMKELRLLSLECLSSINDDKQDQFIKSYFSCGTLAELVFLLEEEIGEDNPLLQAFRTEALKEEEKKLNDEQKKIYEESLNNNIQVIAGPGSGKTHTLTLRVARLIQKEKIDPDHILVLAYNRAVVIELKERLGTLFKKLGYAKLIKRLKVFTFHGFIKFILKDEIKDLDFEDWDNKFLEIAKNRPGEISHNLGTIRYVFVDEFQDITAERMELLKHIAQPGKVKVCVIGDPNQSIYGYQRVKAGGSMDPKAYYESFDKLYQPEVFELRNNYRSYPEILKKAEQLLSLNDSKFDMPPLLAKIIPEYDDKTYCEIIKYEKENKVKWSDKLFSLLESRDDNGEVRFTQVAVMFRTNAEIFKAYNNLISKDLSKYRIRIQGSKFSPFRSREFFYFVNILKKQGYKSIPSNFTSKLIKEIDRVKGLFKNWDLYLIDLFYGLVLEFLEIAEDKITYNNLYEFIEGLADKEDGHLSKIFEKRAKKISKEDSKQEIVLTTMHKVKGIEFDAVLIPPSFADLPVKKPDQELSKEKKTEIIEEERRLYYVAYTRAKYALSVIEWEREKHMRDGDLYQFSEGNEIREKGLGILLEDGIDKFNISWGAGDYGRNSFKFIKKDISLGDEVEIRREKRGEYIYYDVYSKDRIIGQLERKTAKKLNKYKIIKGFKVSAVVVYTYEETIKYDEKNTTSFSKKWTEEAIKRGYIYLVDFSGYGKGLEN